MTNPSSKDAAMAAGMLLSLAMMAAANAALSRTVNVLRDSPTRGATITPARPDRKLPIAHTETPIAEVLVPDTFDIASESTIPQQRGQYPSHERCLFLPFRSSAMVVLNVTQSNVTITLKISNVITGSGASPGAATIFMFPKISDETAGRETLRPIVATILIRVDACFRCRKTTAQNSTPRAGPPRTMASIPADHGGKPC